MESMIRAAMEKGSRILFICERRILVEQFSAHLQKAGIEHGVLMAKHWRFRPYEKVQIASAQTLEAMKSIPAVDIVFIDELHACMRKSIIDMIKGQPNLRIVGATATPFHPAIGSHFTNVVSVTTMAKLVEENFLVPFRVFVAKEIDTKGLKVVAGEWKKDDLEKRGQQIVGDVVADYIRISNDVFGGYRKTICFSCGIAHGAELAQKFNEEGINAIQISSQDDEEYRDEVLKDFAKPDSAIKVLISVAILSRGFDQSDVEYVILARPLKKSFSEHVQMVGRGARIHDGKKMCVIQDNSGNWLRFADDWDTLYNDGVSELSEGKDSKPKKEPTDAQKEAAKCPKCSAVWAAHSDTCLNCGHVRTKRSDVQVVAGEMVEIGASKRQAEKFTPQFKADFYAQLLGHAEKNNWKSGWAYYAYKDKFSVFPSMEKPEPVMPTAMINNWITSRNIRNAKSNKRGNLQ
jgi:superfamily II DNA or RNA helicase